MGRQASSKAIQHRWEKVYREGWYCATCKFCEKEHVNGPPYRNCTTPDPEDCPGIPKHMLILKDTHHG